MTPLESAPAEQVERDSKTSADDGFDDEFETILAAAFKEEEKNQSGASQLEESKAGRTPSPKARVEGKIFCFASSSVISRGGTPLLYLEAAYFAK